MITPVNRVMTRKLVTVQTGTSVLAASKLMTEKRIRHLPVIDDDDNMIGMISQRDLSLLSDAAQVAVDWIMSSPVLSVHQNQPLKQAILTMLQQKVSCLIVSDDEDNAIGIVTTDDLLWFLSSLLTDETVEKKLVPDADTIQFIGQVANRISDLGI